MNITCPSYVLINQQITCSLFVVSNNVNFSILIDFADNDIRQITANDNTVYLFKTYITYNVNNISVKILNNGFEIFYVVNGNEVIIKMVVFLLILFFILAYELVLDCPLYVLKLTQFNCSLSAQTESQDLLVFLNYNDYDTRVLNFNNDLYIVSKTYLQTKNYNIIAYANKTNMSVSKTINGKIRNIIFLF